ncbi:hypothetical protein Cgig2_033643 [Carnegiea gigantea]|uniref:Uncharacterized protein n=1 Tax=Carnegiea gigantea TaxID=171969 RepID=A0A9Q1JJ04_9CARY|nr:hypothetical protein Cgig2_033643 [Carnegiea gigantea]
MECRELKKALYELTNKGQIDQFLRRGQKSICSRHVPCNVKGVKVQKPAFVMAEWRGPVSIPTMVFDRQTMTLVGVICLPWRFGDIAKSKNLEVNFVVVDIQYETEDESIGKLFRDQQTPRECYLVSIKPLVERQDRHEAPLLGHLHGHPSRPRTPMT